MLSLYVLLLVPLVSRVDCWFSGDTCTYDGERGTCKELSKCDHIMSEIEQGGNPMPLHIHRKLHKLACGFNFNEPMICCVTPEQTITDLPNRWQFTSNEDTSNAQTSEPNSTDNTDEDNRDSSPTVPYIGDHPNLRLLPTSNCGAIQEDDKILGGTDTKLYELPWMALLSYDDPRLGVTFKCGGSVINEWYVLTAAHCVTYLGNGVRLNGVILGEHDISKDPDCETKRVQYCAPSVRNVSIGAVIAHPGYRPQTLFDDIGLIRLGEPANLNLDSIKPICLPVTSNLQKQSMVGLMGLVAGWGVTENGHQSSVLQKVDLPVTTHEACRDFYNETLRIYPRQLCAGGEQGKDSCGGDSGGPLIYPGKVAPSGIRYVQRGIVSFGSRRCGIGGFPGVYTNVAYYMDWILDNITS